MVTVTQLIFDCVLNDLPIKLNYNKWTKILYVTVGMSLQHGSERAWPFLAHGIPQWKGIKLNTQCIMGV